MALAHRRLGSEVTVLEMDMLLAKDDRDLVAVARQALLDEGIHIHEGTRATSVSGTAGAIRITTQAADGQEQTFSGTHLLVATGRARQCDGLGLRPGWHRSQPCRGCGIYAAANIEPPRFCRW